MSANDNIGGKSNENNVHGPTSSASGFTSPSKRGNKFGATYLWKSVLRRFYQEMPLKRNKRQFRVFEDADSFTGREAVDFLHSFLPMVIQNSNIKSRNDCDRQMALNLLDRFLKSRYLENVRNEEDMEMHDNATIYRFCNKKIVDFLDDSPIRPSSSGSSLQQPAPSSSRDVRRISSLKADSLDSYHNTPKTGINPKPRDEQPATRPESCSEQLNASKQNADQPSMKKKEPLWCATPLSTGRRIRAPILWPTTKSTTYTPLNPTNTDQNMVIGPKREGKAKPTSIWAIPSSSSRRKGSSPPPPPKGNQQQPKPIRRSTSACSPVSTAVPPVSSTPAPPALPPRENNRPRGRVPVTDIDEFGLWRSVLLEHFAQAIGKEEDRDLSQYFGDPDFPGSHVRWNYTRVHPETRVVQRLLLSSVNALESHQQPANGALPRRLLADLSRLANWSTNRPSSSSASNKYGEGGNSSRYSTSSSLGLEKGLGRGREEGGEMIREGRTTKQRRPVSLSGYSSSSLASTSSSSISVVRHLPSEEEKKKKTSSFGGSVFAPKDEQPSEIFARVLTDLSALGGPILPEAAATGLLHIFDVFRRGKKNVKKITHKRETNLSKNGKKALPPENPTKEVFVVRLAEPEVVDEEDDEATCFPEDGTDGEEMLQCLEDLQASDRVALFAAVRLATLTLPPARLRQLQVLASYFRRILTNPRLPPTLLAAANKDGGEEENVHRERQRRWVLVRLSSHFVGSSSAMALTLTELLVSHSTDCLLELPSQLETVVRARMSALVRGEPDQTVKIESPDFVLGGPSSGSTNNAFRTSSTSADQQQTPCSQQGGGRRNSPTTKNSNGRHEGGFSVTVAASAVHLVKVEPPATASRLLFGGGGGKLLHHFRWSFRSQSSSSSSTSSRSSRHRELPPAAEGRVGKVNSTSHRKRLHSASCSSTSTQTLFHKNEAAEKEDYIPQNTAFCQQIDPRAYADAQTGPVQNRFLLELLDQILGDENLAPALKFDKLKMFRVAHPSVYAARFPTDQMSSQPKSKKEEKGSQPFSTPANSVGALMRRFRRLVT